jgi:hypothetical protein
MIDAETRRPRAPRPSDGTHRSLFSIPASDCLGDLEHLSYRRGTSPSPRRRSSAPGPGGRVRRRNVDIGCARAAWESATALAGRDEGVVTARPGVVLRDRWQRASSGRLGLCLRAQRTRRRSPAPCRWWSRYVRGGVHGAEQAHYQRISLPVLAVDQSAAAGQATTTMPGGYGSAPRPERFP